MISVKESSKSGLNLRSFRLPLPRVIWTGFVLTYLFLPSRVHQLSVFARRLQYESIGLLAVDVATVVLCCVLILLALLGRSRYIPVNINVIGVWAAFLFAPVFASVFSPVEYSRDLAIFAVLDAWAKLALVVLCTLCLGSREARHRTIDLIVLAGIALFLLSFLPGYSAGTAAGRSTSIGLGVNALGLFGAVVFSLCAAAVVSGELPRRKMLQAIGGVVLAFIAVLRSGSRMSLLGVLGAVLYLIISNIVRGRSLSRAAARTVVVVVLVAIGLLVAVPKLPPSLVARFDLSNLGLMQSGRVQLWRVGMEMFYDRPLQGWGIGSFLMVSGVEHPHSLPVQMIVEAGMVGLAVLGVFILKIFKRTRSEPWESGAARTALVAFLLNSLGDNLLTSSKLLLIVIILSCIAWPPKEAKKSANTVL